MSTAIGCAGWRVAASARCIGWRSTRGWSTAIDRHVEVLKVHLPYHESDHVLGIAYNVLCGGTCLQDIELRRQDEVYLDALGAQRIPDPTTAGDFCRRFDEAAHRGVADGDQRDARARLARAAGGVLRRGDHRRGRHAGRDHRAVQGRDGHRLQRRVGLSPVGGVAGQHAASRCIWSTAAAIGPSSEGAAERFDQARALCRERGVSPRSRSAAIRTSPRRSIWIGGTPPGVRFVFGYDARANLIARGRRLADARVDALGAAPAVRGPDRAAPAARECESGHHRRARVQEPAAGGGGGRRVSVPAGRVCDSRTGWSSCGRISRSSKATSGCSTRFGTSSISPTITRPRRPTWSSWPTIAATRRT